MGFHQLCLASVVTMMILLKPIRVGDAALLLKSNATYDGGIGEGLEWEMEMEMEMMESNVIRILQQVNVDPVTPNTLIAEQAIVQKPCYPYTKCLNPDKGKGKGKGKPPPKCRDIYDCKGQLADES
ncbi:hypothetical protein GQ457_05G005220 [Hibiscus cannabinus]